MRPLYVIAEEIHKDWKKVNFAATPYLLAMETMDNIKEDFGYDSGKSIVLYFLSNASTWRGDVARRIKNELNVMVKSEV